MINASSFRRFTDMVGPRHGVPQAFTNPFGLTVLAISFSSAALTAVYLSWRWPLQLDGPLIQYIAFLIDHGKVPYRDIIDLNGIGCYFSSMLELRLFDHSDLGWRVYDLLFLLLGSSGIALITKPFGRVAGIVSISLFVALHIHEGIGELGQRDFQTAALELLGCGLLLHGFRTHRAPLFFLSGMAIVAGATMKPSAIGFLLMILVFAWGASWFSPERRLSQPLWATTGSALAGAVVFAYLVYSGAWWPFVELYRRLLPIYSRMSHQPDYYLRFVLENQLRPLFIPAVLAAAQFLLDLKGWWKKETVIIVIGAACAYLSYLVQGKGFWYHVDPLSAFLVVWCGIGVTKLLADHRALVRLPAAIVLASWLVFWFPVLYRDIQQQKFDPAAQQLLERRIQQFRAQGKNNGIQVMDTTYGAIHALYDLKLVQATGFIYDFLFYSYPEESMIIDLRAKFLREMGERKPDLLVITSQSWPQVGLRYNKMDLWPEFRTFLETNYHLGLEGEFYRIYVHN